MNLKRWLKEWTEWVASGEVYAVYWHGPFVPRWLMEAPGSTLSPEGGIG